MKFQPVCLFTLLALALGLQPLSAIAASSSSFSVGDANVDVQFIGEDFRLPRSVYLDWLKKSAQAITDYYGRFPVKHLVVKVSGTAGGDIGFSTTDFVDGHGEIEIPIGENISARDLTNSWVAAHEMTHLAFPLVDRRRRWVAEGQATYIEPIARLRRGLVRREDVWQDMIKHFPTVLSEDDQGLDKSSTITMTYWGGALFYLLADERIQEETHGRLGLQDGLKAVVAQGGNVGADWTIEQAFDVADKATGTHVLRQLEDEMSTAPARVDLQKLWNDLGIHKNGEQIIFDDRARLAAVRRKIERGA